MALPHEDPGRRERLGTPDWPKVVEGVQAGDTDAVEQLHAFLIGGVRFHLLRHLGPEGLEERVHDTFCTILKAIRSRFLPDPERLIGFVREVLRQQIAGLQLANGFRDHSSSSEENTVIMIRVLQGMTERDRAILARYYLLRQAPGDICSEMQLTDGEFRSLKHDARKRFAELRCGAGLAKRTEAYSVLPHLSSVSAPKGETANPRTRHQSLPAK